MELLKKTRARGINAHVRILMENSENISGRDPDDYELYALNINAIIVGHVYECKYLFLRGNSFFTSGRRVRLEKCRKVPAVQRHWNLNVDWERNMGFTER
jgi:hypothetical protein